MRWSHGSSLGMVFLVLLSLAPAAAAQPRAPFTVGIVECNGNLTPVATFDGEDWNRGGGLSKSWTLWFENTGPDSGRGPRKGWAARLSPARRAIVATGLVRSPLTWSGGNLALATDAGDRVAVLIDCRIRVPEPRMGIATTGEPPPELVERLEPEGKDSRRIAAWARDVFNKLESQALEHVVTNRRYDVLGGFPDPCEDL